MNKQLLLPPKKKMAIEDQPHPFLLLDALYCEEEEKWGEEEEEEEGLDEETNPQNNYTTHNNNNKKVLSSSSSSSSSLFPLLLLEQDLFWEDEELISLFTKEKQTHHPTESNHHHHDEARREAVSWILKVNARYGFSALTSILAVNYLDRFLSTHPYQQDKPWVMQLLAVTCLSLAAKVEETYVPLLLDFQIEDAKYVFEAKTIQKMELVVLSTLKWRMNPITPLSFLDHVIRRLGLKNHLHWEFLKRCENLVLSILPDCRFVRFPPSILATSTMLLVIHQVEPFHAIDYQNQLLGVLKITKEDVKDCYDSISKSSISDAQSSSSKRKLYHLVDEPFLVMKKSRVNEQPMRLPSMSCRMFVDAAAVATPR